jgi:biotin carboxyl carrier protein
MTGLSVTLGGKTHTVVFHDDGRCTVDGDDGESAVLQTGPAEYAVILDGQPYRIVAARTGSGYLVLHGGTQRQATVESERSRLIRQYTQASEQTRRHLEIHAPMPALVGRILVAPGQDVRAGQAVLVLEAMKMENEIKVHQPGLVKEILVARGQTVEKGQLLLTLE